MSEQDVVPEVEHRAEFLELVDPELREAALMMRAMTAGYTPMSRDKLAQRRAWMEAAAQPPAGHVAYHEVMIERIGCPADPGTVPAFVVNARPGARSPAILHLHGGGFTASKAIYGMTAVQQAAAALDVPMVTVDYRLAPETVWSGSLEDNYSALLWMVAHADELGVDPARIAVMGESAGGGHAALLALAVRDRGEVSLCFQSLIYPMIDDRAGTSRQLAGHIGYFGWNPEANRFGWESFLGRAPGGDEIPAAAVPSRRTDLAGLPPAFIAVGALDLFVDEDIAYAQALNGAGVPVELLVVPGAFHGFDSFVPGAAVSQRFIAAKIEALRRGLGLPPV